MWKSTTVFCVLTAIQAVHPQCDFYMKMGVLCKWWDSYNNQFIAWTDDPVKNIKENMDAEASQQFKNVALDRSWFRLKEDPCSSPVDYSVLVLFYFCFGVKNCISPFNFSLRI